MRTGTEQLGRLPGVLRRIAVVMAIAAVGLVVPTAAHAATPTAKVVDAKATVKTTADDTQVTTVLTIQVSKPVSRKGGGVGPQDVVTYTCTTEENYPHNSTHVPGQMNVTGSTTCQVPMATIDLAQYLYLNGRNWAYGYNYATPGGTYQTVQANATCQAGNWQGVLNYWLTWPAGSNPPATSGTLYTPVLYLTC